MTTETIGCAGGYQAMIVRQAGDMTGQGIKPESAGMLKEIVTARWGRVRKRAAEAQVVVTKCPSNCGFITQSANWTGIDPWAHELWMWRDGALAFQGPIVEIRETRNTFIITARDMVQWLYAREIREPYDQTWTVPGVAHSLINTYFTPSDPDLMRHVVTFPYSSGSITVQYDRSQYTVGQKWDELTSNGLDYTTVGRSIYIMDNSRPPNYDYPFMIDADKILGDIELQKNGLDYGNHVVCLGEGIVYGIGPSASDEAYYGKVTFPPNRFNMVKDQGQLNNVTHDFYQAKRNLTPRLVVPQGSGLSPDTVVYNELYELSENAAKMAFSHFIPGFRFDVRVGEEFCQQGSYPMVLSELAVMWDPSGDGSPETTNVSFENLPAGDDNGEA